MTDPIRLTHSDSDSCVQVDAGARVVVRLAENPTTGYRWAVERLEGPLSLDRDDFELSEPTPGAGGTRILEFEAGAPGRASVALVLKREWETAAEDRFTVDVDVTAHSADDPPG